MDPSPLMGLEVEPDLQIEISMDAPTRMDENSPCFIPCIQRIPNWILEQKKSAYHPSMVSIGPLHSGDQHLHEMEAVKRCYMDSLLERADGRQETLKRKLKDAVKELEAGARQCYAEGLLMKTLVPDDDDQNTSRFAKIMLIDGCFIIELLLRSWGNEEDPILRNCMRLVPIRKDLLLLENQIPFFVLRKLFNIITQNYIPTFPSLTDCIEYFFFSIVFFLEKKQTENVHGNDSYSMLAQTQEEEDANVCHMVHLLHKLCKPSQVPTAENEYDTELKYSGELKYQGELKYSATDLDKSGVKFVAAANGKHLFNVKFTTDHSSCFRLCRRGRFQIPSFNMCDDTETFLRNMIAFEQTSMGKNHYYFTSHALLMDKLINTADDVKLLEKAGIIHNHFDSREELSTLFTNICKNIYAEKYCFNRQRIDINNYCKHRFRRLRRTYFSNPWSLISAISAFILFVLTLVQTICALLSYY